ncbi:MAG: hypothetical protein QOJ65_2550 [Fimbriimonadaceae bacterium]|nr:hypothetical protein [Fimbriimonadaceae bacterium]
MAMPAGIELSVEKLSFPYAFWKRVLDLVVASILLIVFMPLLLLIALLVRVTSRGPIIYMCRRVGKGGRTFRFVKFRTMYTDADSRLAELLQCNEKDGPIFKMKNDPRITPIGRILRRTSLDELPQLLNVVRGSMSLVGPRPPLPREVELYDNFAARRLSVKPGMTCYWQISGRSNLSFEEWMQLDNKYIEEMGFWTDLKILVKTVPAILRAEGAY